MAIKQHVTYLEQNWGTLWAIRSQRIAPPKRNTGTRKDTIMCLLRNTVNIKFIAKNV